MTSPCWIGYEIPVVHNNDFCVYIDGECDINVYMMGDRERSSSHYIRSEFLLTM